ncbi:toxin RelE3 [mine drainage metagenome]|uniref:Toxin RelE3 n=1 Tax=mine drainage metagenome TaxID=410659 RepID=A0A1J5QAS8_9ZZZZ
MPQVRFTPAALRDLQRLREFLRPKNPAAARRAAASIIQAVQVLGGHPAIGRPVEGLESRMREWLVDFGGAGGYVVLYRDQGATVDILAIRHQKEAGYR